MNISDEVTATTMNVVTRATESGMHLLDRIVDCNIYIVKFNRKSVPFWTGRMIKLS